MDRCESPRPLLTSAPLWAGVALTLAVLIGLRLGPYHGGVLLGYFWGALTR